MPSAPGSNRGSASATFSGGDGGSKDTAIIVNAKSDADGTHAIYAWLKQNCNCKVSGQSLVTDAGRVFDLMEGDRADGTKVSYFFDITKSFGKW
jgi:hypothetical protein